MNAHDARSARRQRTLLSGKLIFGPHELSADCTILDLTEAGARVRLPVDLAAIDNVWLILITAAVAYRAELRWRDGRTLGLSFSEHRDLKSEAPEELDHMRQLWLECQERPALL